MRRPRTRAGASSVGHRLGDHPPGGATGSQVAIAASRDSVAGTTTTFTISAAPATGSNATIQNVQVTFGDGAAAVDLGAVSGDDVRAASVCGPRDLYRVDHRHRQRWRDSDRVHPGRGRGARGADGFHRGRRRSRGGPTTTFTISVAPATGSNAAIRNVRVTFGDGTAPVDLGGVTGNAITSSMCMRPPALYRCR